MVKVPTRFFDGPVRYVLFPWVLFCETMVCMYTVCSMYVFMYVYNSYIPQTEQHEPER